MKVHQFEQLHKTAGPAGFTKMIVETAPYFASIDPVLTKLEPGSAEVALKNQKKVHNHLGTVHAIAICNAAELAAGMTTTVSIPEGAIWIPKAMTVAYLAKAKTDLTVVVEAKGVDFSIAGDIVVPVTAYDEQGKKVFSAEITMNVKHT